MNIHNTVFNISFISLLRVTNSGTFITDINGM